MGMIGKTSPSKRNLPAFLNTRSPPSPHSNAPTAPQGARASPLHHSITPSLHHSITPSLHHSITPSLHHSSGQPCCPVGRVWPWPARLSATRRRQATTILTSRVISRHFPALHRRHRSAATLRSADFQSAALRLTHNTARSPQLHCSDAPLRTKVRAPFDTAPTSMNAKGQTHDHSSGQPCCPRRTSVALARSSISGPPTPSHHDLDTKHHLAPLPRAPPTASQL